MLPATLQDVSSRVFDGDAMREHLSPDVFARLVSRAALSATDRSAVAQGMQRWAMARGASTFVHWFSPMRGGNAGKVDTFIDLDWSHRADAPSGERSILVDFSGPRLFQSETDGSSFPNGGLRATHRAAAYMGWDQTSPPFVRHGTLYIPSVLVSHEGDSLDYKTPLLRSQEAISRAGVRLLRALGDEDTSRVLSNVGWEQEMFVVDRELYNRRPDLIATGRTLFGRLPVRNQSREEHYFSSMNPRVRALFAEVNAELLSLGVSMNTTHAEVAPGQFEFCPIFTLSSRAADQNVLAREVADEFAARHGLVVLWNEKPFAGINGSGKHNNWGLNTDTGANLFVAGDLDHEQERFVAFTTALVRSIHLHGDLLRIGTASAGNDHRLGAQEAPPAIISLYTGDVLGEHLRDIAENGGPLNGYSAVGAPLKVGSHDVQTLSRSCEDRNRTAPFPYCSNRFEFRAVGSSANIAWPVALLNTAMAESCDKLAHMIEETNVRDAVRAMLNDHLTGVFNGDNYDPAWVDEAERRGLPHLRSTAEALPELTSEKNVQLLMSQRVALSSANVDAWKHIMAEQLAETIRMESRVMLEALESDILPVVLKSAADVHAGVSAVGAADGTALAKYSNRSATLAHDLADAADALSAALDAADDSIDSVEQAKYAQDVLRPAMTRARTFIDEAERRVPRAQWPFPYVEDLVLGNEVMSEYE